MSAPIRKSRLWLEKSSADDCDSKIIRQRMGMTVSDFLNALDSGISCERADLWYRTWPKHSFREFRDPVYGTCSRDPSDSGWSIQYKAFGCSNMENAALSKEKSGKLDSVRSNESRLRDDIITLAQQRELIKTLQLSDSDEESNSEDKQPSLENSTVVSKAISFVRNSPSSVDGRLCSLPQLVSPLPSTVIEPKISVSSNSIQQYVPNRHKEGASKAKYRKRSRDLNVGPDLEKPSVYSSESNADVMNDLVSLPVQRVNDQKNASSLQKQNDSYSFVRRVLVDVEAFCKPFLHLPNHLSCCDKSSRGSARNTLSNSINKENANLSQSSFLNKVSPLSKTHVYPTQKVLPSQPSKDFTPVSVPHNEETIASSPNQAKSVYDVSWIVSSAEIIGLKPFLSSILPVSKHRMSCVDKLAAIRFLLNSLRISNSTTCNGTPRKLTGVLLTANVSKPPQFVDGGTTFTPNRTSASATQYDIQELINAATQTSLSHVSAITNTSPSLLMSNRVSASINTENAIDGFSTDFSTDYCLKKVVSCNNDAMERTIKSFQGSTEEEQLTQASNLNTEAAASWSKLVKFVAATSSSSSSNSVRPFVCSCTPVTQRFIHSLFSQNEFTSYPEKVLSSTRHLLVAALMSTSTLAAVRRYEQALESLAKTASRMRRAESKLLRRTWVAMRHSASVDLPVAAVAELGDDAKRWSDLWYSTLARVRAAISDKFYQLLADKELKLRKKVTEDTFLKCLTVLNTETDLSTSLFCPSTPLGNGSMDDQPCAQSPMFCESDDSRSAMCAISRSTLESLVQVFQITSLVGGSMQYRQESELILPTDQYCFVGCQGDWNQQQLPVFVSSAPSTDMTPLIAYIDSVLQLHRRIVSSLSVCPEISQYQFSVISYPQSKMSPSPLAPPPAPPPASKPNTEQKGKYFKSPVPPPSLAFNDPISPNNLVVSKCSIHRKRRQSSQSDKTVGSELSEKGTKKKNKDSPLSSRHSPKHSIHIIKEYRSLDELPQNHVSCDLNATSSRRDFHRSEGIETDSPTNPSRFNRERKRSREKSKTQLNGIIGDDSMETYSPRKNSSISASSYSPSRPAFSNEKHCGGNAVDNTYGTAYVPSIPAHSASQRIHLRNLLSKPSIHPDFYAKWIGRDSSNRR